MKNLRTVNRKRKFVLGLAGNLNESLLGLSNKSNFLLKKTTFFMKNLMVLWVVTMVAITTLSAQCKSGGEKMAAESPKSVVAQDVAFSSHESKLGQTEEMSVLKKVMFA